MEETRPEITLEQATARIVTSGEGTAIVSRRRILSDVGRKALSASEPRVGQQAQQRRAPDTLTLQTSPPSDSGRSAPESLTVAPPAQYNSQGLHARSHASTFDPPSTANSP